MVHWLNANVYRTGYLVYVFFWGGMVNLGAGPQGLLLRWVFSGCVGPLPCIPIVIPQLNLSGSLILEWKRRPKSSKRIADINKNTEKKKTMPIYSIGHAQFPGSLRKFCHMFGRSVVSDFSGVEQEISSHPPHLEHHIFCPGSTSLGVHHNVIEDLGCFQTKRYPKRSRNGRPVDKPKLDIRWFPGISIDETGWERFDTHGRTKSRMKEWTRLNKLISFNGIVQHNVYGHSSADCQENIPGNIISRMSTQTETWITNIYLYIPYSVPLYIFHVYQQYAMVNTMK